MYMLKVQIISIPDRGSHGAEHGPKVPLCVSTSHTPNLIMIEAPFLNILFASHLLALNSIGWIPRRITLFYDLRT